MDSSPTIAHRGIANLARMDPTASAHCKPPISCNDCACKVTWISILRQLFLRAAARLGAVEENASGRVAPNTRKVYATSICLYAWYSSSTTQHFSCSLSRCSDHHGVLLEVERTNCHLSDEAFPRTPK